MKRKIINIASVVTLYTTSTFSNNVYAVNPVLPSSVDAGRLITEEKSPPIISKKEQDFQIPKSDSFEAIPESAKKIQFTLKNVKVDGMTAFSEKEVKDIYIANLDKKVSLSLAWEIANKLTKKYKAAGYFLSKAYVPEQKVKNGKIVIKVFEGYISKVSLSEKTKNSKIIQTYVDRLLKDRPTTIDKLEEFILKTNDLPGYSCRAVLTKDEEDKNGVNVVIKDTEHKDSAGSISYDNYASRYSGVNEINAGYTTVLAPLQQTSINTSSSIPTDKSTSGAIQHSVVIAPDLKLGLSANTVKTYPGYTLKSYDINSSANSTGINLNYQFIRQRLENLSSKLAFNTVNVNSNILGSPLSKDHIRAIRIGFDYEKFDNWHGKNLASFTYSKGVHALGASKANDPYISRSGAKPDFSKIELSLSRTQEIYKDWEAMLFTSGQHSSNTLYSAEQFGYGGQSFGKAYDNSEITGDKGINAGLELRYNGLSVSEKAMFQPFTFYDVGKVKNNYISDSTSSAASAGLGVKFATIWNQSGSLGVAWPLTRKVSEPIYGHNRKSPRFMIQFSQGF